MMECLSIHLSVCLSIYEIYIAPLQGNYSEALSAQARAKIKVLRSLLNELDKSRGREWISDGRLFQAEGPTIVKALCCLMRYHKITSGGRAKRLSASTGRS